MRITYGDATSQFGDLTLPPTAAPAAGHPVVVLIHGGFWKSVYALDLMEPLAADLASRGFAVWNIEYRRVGEAGGGWPGTLEDVAAAIDELDALSSVHALDLGRVATVGHSAGGHLALWAAGRAALPTGAPGADPNVLPTLAGGQGPVADLRAGAAAGLGGGAVVAMLGGTPEEFPDRYDVATPGVTADATLVVVRGTRDDIVPAQFTIPPGAHEPRAVEVVDVDGADHFDLIDPDSLAWAAVLEALARL